MVAYELQIDKITFQIVEGTKFNLFVALNYVLVCRSNGWLSIKSAIHAAAAAAAVAAAAGVLNLG
jgi:hypothetical protein